MRVLVVEDERKVADAIQEGLQAEHYDVVVERTGEDGYSRVTTETFDLVLLDLGRTIISSSRSPSTSCWPACAHSSGAADPMRFLE